MSKTISVADDVYRWLKNKKQDKSFSEFIRETIGSGDLKELEGIGFSTDWEETENTLEEASNSNIETLQRETR
jgi:predicted CopG family antitoxin